MMESQNTLGAISVHHHLSKFIWNPGFPNIVYIFIRVHYFLRSLGYQCYTKPNGFNDFMWSVVHSNARDTINVMSCLVFYSKLHSLAIAKNLFACSSTRKGFPKNYKDFNWISDNIYTMLAREASARAKARGSIVRTLHAPAGTRGILSNHSTETGA